MRTYQEMMDLILNIAKQDERIRAVIMNGSRTNPNAPKDPFQDYDIVYLVTEIDSFLHDPQWVDAFGERIIMQTPEDMELFPPANNGHFAYLMLFADGNRIDLTLVPIDEKESCCRADKLTLILLDKDRSIPEIAPPTDEDYWVQLPSAAFFADCCNEFWWVSTYVAKGLWRNEILYALDHLHIIRQMLVKMLEWQVGIQTDFAVSTGKNGKYLQKYMAELSWKELLSTYPGGSCEEAWISLFAMCKLFRSSSLFVAERLGFEYPARDDQRVSAYLEQVRSLPSDAAEIF
ncbi:aminoglycoside 6-adenylyltransferase [Paenibacillus donghaensis]|uniref:aminoglycoside 6-adenylyltransferase n=1 Tax=Paenibacillus donghaensis TaxID=414771 RepID=UPI00188472C6|nr:aminoglycoside 6-adenylyltransferase [Paenibacillus donghaensis]MBE9913525.1 aminoglycoside 6-adenylyltransferase [Paenibacillus donghaensis]